jgi:hypothetical protein
MGVMVMAMSCVDRCSERQNGRGDGTSSDLHAG